MVGEWEDLVVEMQVQGVNTQLLTLFDLYKLEPCTRRLYRQRIDMAGMMSLISTSSTPGELVVSKFIEKNTDIFFYRHPSL
jgi:hypothetical protein